jgi:hypothetical protein
MQYFVDYITIEEHYNYINNAPGVKEMSRYDTAEWKELVSIQNGMWHVDILTITGFMDHEAFIRHLERYRAIANK